jgi:hypothetical protein
MLLALYRQRQFTSGPLVGADLQATSLAPIGLLQGGVVGPAHTSYGLPPTPTTTLLFVVMPPPGRSIYVPGGSLVDFDYFFCVHSSQWPIFPICVHSSPVAHLPSLSKPCMSTFFVRSANPFFG